MPPAFMGGVARRAGGSPDICEANIRKARFALQSGQNPSDPAAPGFARIHRATSPINRGGKIFSMPFGIGGIVVATVAHSPSHSPIWRSMRSLMRLRNLLGEMTFKAGPKERTRMSISVSSACS